MEFSMLHLTHAVFALFKSASIHGSISVGNSGKPLFECVGSICMGIAQIALDPPSPRPPLPLPLSNRQTWKKVPQTILASLYIPGQRGKKVPKTILAGL